MIQQKLAGKRCRALQPISMHQGRLQRDTHGTIRHELDNLDRHLIFVNWDNGIDGFVFPREIELLAED
jgi:hypothetical protein